MARQLRIEYEGALYHVIARGNERKRIYSTDRDKERFLDYIQRAHKKFGIKMHAYCLMSNHYHLFIETPQANLSRSMQYINSGYTVYYNLKQKRSGHLFQGRYKAVLVEKDAYLQELNRYIHLNPVRKNITKRPEEYRWSSYQYYQSRGKKIPEYMEVKATLGYFKNREMYQEFVMNGIERKADNLNLMVKAGCILGREEFVEEIKDRYLDKNKKLEDLPGLRQLKKERKDSKIIKKIINRSKMLGEKEKVKVLIYFIRKYTGKTLGGIVKEFLPGKSISAVSKIVKRLEDKIRNDNEAGRVIKDLEVEMSKVKV